MQSTLSERLKEAMKGPPKITGRALAKACNITPTSVSDWLTGKSKSMDGPNLIAAAELLKVRPKWLAEAWDPCGMTITVSTRSTQSQPSNIFPSPKWIN